MITGLVWKPWYFVPKDFSRSNQDSKVCQLRWWLYCKNILDIISIFCESSSLHRLQTFGERLTLYIAYTDVSSYPCYFTLYTAIVHLLHKCICTVHSYSGGSSVPWSTYLNKNQSMRLTSLRTVARTWERRQTGTKMKPTSLEPHQECCVSRQFNVSFRYTYCLLKLWVTAGEARYRSEWNTN